MYFFLDFVGAAEALENFAQTMLIIHLLCIQEMVMQRLFTLLMCIQQEVDLNSIIS